VRVLPLHAGERLPDLEALRECEQLTRERQPRGLRGTVGGRLTTPSILLIYTESEKFQFVEIRIQRSSSTSYNCVIFQLCDEDYVIGVEEKRDKECRIVLQRQCR
jgi:hypothetical protein